MSRMSSSIVGVLVLACALAGCVSEAGADADSQADAWVEVLVEARELGAFTGIGLGRTDESVAWARLLERADASERFVEVVERGSAVGAVYGLSGLWLADREAFAGRWVDVARVLHERDEPVRFMRGCASARRSRRAP